MWELIRANKRKSLVLFFAMGICLLVLGYVIGRAYNPETGGIMGIFFACMLWIILSLISYYAGDSILLSVSRAQEVTYDVHPQLFNVVEEMKIASGLPAMPKVYIIDERAPNAFATGRSPDRSSIAVTAGLLSRLKRDELQGVVAHEMSHILNRDVLFMTFAGVMLGAVALISEVFLRSLWYSGGSARRYRSSSRSSGQAQFIIMVVAIALAILAPIVVRILYFAISRKREYLADASAVRLTRYPEGLASALEKIAYSDVEQTSVNKITAPMYIINPLQSNGLSASGLFSTHPPIRRRIDILRAMQSGVSYAEYQKAFNKNQKKGFFIIPKSGLKDTSAIPIEKPVEKPKEEISVKSQNRALGDLMRAVNKYAFLTCACGLKIKIPPHFKEPAIDCPRCGNHLEVPLAEMSAMIIAAGEVEKIKGEKSIRKNAQEKPKIYHRRGMGWESFYCSCGKLLQISPQFEGKYVTCNKCGRKTEIS